MRSSLLLLPAGMVLLTLIVTGCASSQIYRDTVVLDDDPNRSTAEFKGVTGSSPDATSQVINSSATWFIRSWVNKRTGKTSHQLYVRIVYTGSDWQYYNRAISERGISFGITDIEKEVRDCDSNGVCTYREDVGVDLNDGFLSSNRNGFTITLFSQTGDEVAVQVNQDQIEEQMVTIKNYKYEKL